LAVLVIVPPPKIAQPQHRLQLGSLGLGFYFDTNSLRLSYG
jgi:hypothetical protein